MKKYIYRNQEVTISHITSDTVFYIINGIIKSIPVNSFFNEAIEVKEVTNNVIIPVISTNNKTEKVKEEKKIIKKEKVITRPKIIKEPKIKEKKVTTKKTTKKKEIEEPKKEIIETPKELPKIENVVKINNDDPYEGYL